MAESAAFWTLSVAFGSSMTAEDARRRLELAVRQHFALVWRLCRRLGVPTSGVDDAAQQVCLVAAQRAEDIAPGSERAFLCRTAVKVASNSRRVARRHAGRDVVDDELRSEAPSADELSDQKRARAVLDACLAEMDEDVRTAFVLFELEGMKTTEIAEITSAPMGTVASRLRRGREELQSKLAAKGFGGAR
jgi:RNA polymerase sigma-70 factor (ECF subfamily)